MKKLSEIKVNASKLKLIIGENINFPFPTKERISKVNGDIKRIAQPVSLAKVIEGSSWANKRSHDERFDDKHPVILATISIKERGLNKAIIAGIRNDKKCQKKKAICGKWAVLNDLITDEHRAQIEKLLSDTHDAKLVKFGPYYFA
jgi:hypothetical protein